MTYSIAAVDTETGEVGGAGTSCLDGSDVHVIYRGVPGRGVVHAQAYYSAAGRDRAAQLLAQGSSAADALATITAPSFDRSLSLRQYGIVDAGGRAAGYTGTGTSAFAADVQSTVGTFTYTAQGNILTSARVLEQAAAGFESGGCDLAERLMRGLRAGADGGEGDSRCTPAGIPSDSAFLQVERPLGAEGDYLTLRVETSGSADPLAMLQAQFDTWRLDHPCPVRESPASAEAGIPSDSGCACQLGVSASGAPMWVLVGCLLVVGSRRWTARQLRPALLP